MAQSDYTPQHNHTGSVETLRDPVLNHSTTIRSMANDAQASESLCSGGILLICQREGENDARARVIYGD